MKENNRVCITCGKTYSYCPHCGSEDARKPVWYNIYCSENCRNVFNTASDYAQGEMDANTARDAFSKCDLTNKNNFKESIKSIIDSVLSVKTVSTKKYTKETSKQDKE